MRRRVAGAMLAVVSTLVLTGCSVPTHGESAMGKDARGRVIGVVQMCSGHVDGMTLYRDTNGRGEDPAKDWAFGRHVRASATIHMSGAVELMATAPRRTWYFYAGSDDDTSAAWGPGLTLERLRSIAPGHVYGLDWSRKDPAPAEMTIRTFRSGVLAHCDEYR